MLTQSSAPLLHLFSKTADLDTPGLQLTVWVSLLSSNQLVLSSVVSNCKCLILMWNQYLLCLCTSLGHSDIVTPLYFQFSCIFDIFVSEVHFENAHANISFLKSTFKSSLSPKSYVYDDNDEKKERTKTKTTQQRQTDHIMALYFHYICADMHTQTTAKYIIPNLSAGKP